MSLDESARLTLCANLSAEAGLWEEAGGYLVLAALEKAAAFERLHDAGCGTFLDRTYLTAEVDRALRPIARAVEAITALKYDDEGPYFYGDEGIRSTEAVLRIVRERMGVS